MMMSSVWALKVKSDTSFPTTLSVQEKKKSNGKENISYGANAPFAETGRCSPGEEILLLALC